jgi:hypothetical protein
MLTLSFVAHEALLGRSRHLSRHRLMPVTHDPVLLIKYMLCLENGSRASFVIEPLSILTASGWHGRCELLTRAIDGSFNFVIGPLFGRVSNR